ncbi:MAG: holo-ACP synthase [Betaproteobacteria bacterium AqS2]|uniref:Holo-[acyl-carrier-protein] synthase n=1 Tax=Candidatus Amphirhobacter heronislandensis TaxID=1732024 RepID=A0A930UC41_9GAMM|nr:holo-ACP synthase [Betaproteobacteria bacterium AqS2]
MILGVGVDLVAVARMERLDAKWGGRLAKRVLAASEIAALPRSAAARARRLALAFAAKEAFAKAMGTGFAHPVTLGQVAVERDEAGAPRFAFGPELAKLLRRRKVARTHLSLSDDGGQAVAVAVLEDAG